MAGRAWNQRFLSSSRGQILLLLRRGPRTVNELAAALKLTDNAVRAHLAELASDGLARAVGQRPGFRKPHTEYEITPAAEHHFPKPYGPLLHELLGVLAEQMPVEERERMLREVGHRMAAAYLPHMEGRDLHERVARAVRALKDLGGLAELEKHPGGLRIRGYSCPLAEAAAGHPEVCRLAETFLSELIGVPVRECCSHEGTPRCCFEVGEAHVSGS